MPDAIELVERVSEDGVAVSAIALSRLTPSSATPIGPGSTTAMALTRLGKCILRGVDSIILRRRLSSIHRSVRTDCRSAGQDSEICDNLLFFSRRGAYPNKVKRKAWDIIMYFILNGEVSGLVNSLARWREVEIQIFLNEALRRMPFNWIADPLAKRSKRDSVSSDHRFPSEGDKIKFARGFLKLLQELISHAGLALDRRKDRTKHESFAISLASFVSGSGKMVLGPSTLPEKIKVHFGDNVLYTIVQSIICGRLNTVSTRLRLEVGTSVPSVEMTGMLDEMLFIRRSFVHDRCIQRQTQELLFISVSRFHALALIPSAASLPEEDLKGLVFEVISWLKPFVYSGMHADNFLPKAYRAYLVSHASNNHPVIPFLYFCIHLARSSAQAAHLFLDFGLVDLLRDMCVHDFPNPAENVINTSSRTDRVAQSDIYASLTLFFAAVSTHSSCASRIVKQTDLPPWILSLYYTSDFIGLPTAPLLQDTWMVLEPSITKLVLVSLECTVKGNGLHRRHVTRRVDLLPLEHVYRDLITAIRDNNSGQDMLYSAADTFLTCVEFGAGSRRCLNKILSEATVQETCELIEMVYRCLIPDFPPFFAGPSRAMSADNYLTALAHAYASELRWYSPLVDKLIAPQATGTGWSFGQSSRAVVVHDSVISFASIAE
ncbi:hypothetical protein BDW22DRAFT_606863 [Trametopsis cervina]|nr:hypothetical protein BDW22DRAFT_606863 [Trametopsis cervina]